MLDFQPVREKKTTINDLTAHLTKNDLRHLTNEMVDRMQALIANSLDADVTFIPNDPDAYDSYAENEADLKVSWTLGHVIVHTTASSEEAAFIAAELARGVPFQPRRSRYETPWQQATTIAQCRERLEASRHMRLALLDAWPQPPHLDNTYSNEYAPIPSNAVVRFARGLMHDDSHLGQIAEIVRQAHAARPTR
jgi:hypothetical protein